MADQCDTQQFRAAKPCDDYLGGISTQSPPCSQCGWPIHEHPADARLLEWLEERRTQPISPDPYDPPELPKHLQGEPV